MPSRQSGTNLGRTSVCLRRSEQPENETLALQHPTSCPTYDTHFVPLRALMTVHPAPLNLKLPPPTGWWVDILERPCVAAVISVAVTTAGPPFQWLMRLIKSSLRHHLPERNFPAFSFAVSSLKMISVCVSGSARQTYPWASVKRCAVKDFCFTVNCRLVRGT